LKNLSRTLAAFGCIAYATAAAAQDSFPSRPIRMICPVNGGSIEIVARTVAPKLAEALGQPVIVENRAGGAGNIGTDLVAKAAPDGYTILVAFAAPIVVNVSLFDKLPFDPTKDLAPITLAIHASQFLVVSSDVPANNVRELIDYAKARPGKLNYASIGVGSTSHLTMEMFKHAAGLDLVHVPYKGGAGASADMLSGNVQAAFLVSGNVLPFLKSGKIKVLASTGRTRAPSLPAVPTLTEAGVPLEALGWVGFMAPAGTPKAILARYSTEMLKILKMKDVRERLETLDMDVVGGTPEEFGSFIRAEIAKWAKVIKQTGARANLSGLERSDPSRSAAQPAPSAKSEKGESRALRAATPA